MSELLGEIASRLDPLGDLAERIGEAIHEDPPVSIKEGGIIREGYNPELDRLLSLSRDGKSWIQQFRPSRGRENRDLEPQSGLQPGVRVLHLAPDAKRARRTRSRNF